MKTYPSTNILDLLRLIGRIIRAFVGDRQNFDISAILAEWLHTLTKRHKSPNIVINLLFRKILLVSSRDLSEHILAGTPSTQHYAAGTLKQKAMSFLAPNALTISHDEQWQGLREYNEKVLCPAHRHPHQQDFLAQVHAAFDTPVSNMDDIRYAMGKTMLGVVFGKNAAREQLIDDIQILFGEVGLKTALLGSRETRRRDRFYRDLQQIRMERASVPASTLLHMAHNVEQEGDVDQFSTEILVQQIPHWMFTFTNSGSDLLARTLVIITSRPEIHERVRNEIAGAGVITQADALEQLDYLEACLLETCRLFPPVVQTAHRTQEGDTFDGVHIPAESEIVHFFPLNYRDTSVDLRANHFYPERWLDPAQQAEQMYPNLFLSGVRACPGRRLILFICKAAIAVLLEQHGITSEGKALAYDPVPFSFPDRAILFRSDV